MRPGPPSPGARRTRAGAARAAQGLAGARAAPRTRTDVVEPSPARFSTSGGTWRPRRTARPAPSCRRRPRCPHEGGPRAQMYGKTRLPVTNSSSSITFLSAGAAMATRMRSSRTSTGRSCACGDLAGEDGEVAQRDADLVEIDARNAALLGEGLQRSDLGDGAALDEVRGEGHPFRARVEERLFELGLGDRPLLARRMRPSGFLLASCVIPRAGVRSANGRGMRGQARDPRAKAGYPTDTTGSGSCAGGVGHTAGSSAARTPPDARGSERTSRRARGRAHHPPMLLRNPPGQRRRCRRRDGRCASLRERIEEAMATM